MSELRLRAGRVVDLVARMWLGLAILIAVTSQGHLMQLDMRLVRVTVGSDKLGLSISGDSAFQWPRFTRHPADGAIAWELDPFSLKQTMQQVDIHYFQTSALVLCWSPTRPILSVAVSHLVHILLAVAFNALLYWRRLESIRKPDSRPRSELQAELWGARETDSDQSSAPHADPDSQAVEESVN